MCLPWNHKWEISETLDVNRKGNRIKGRFYVLECTKCGNLKKKKLLVE